jgi:hypothetical protein
VRTLVVAIASIVLFGCKRERPPRDYQSSPPAMTHPVTSSSGTPTAHGMPGPAPEPSSGAEGNNAGGKPTGPNPPTLTLKDQPPANTHATQTTSTAVTGTHLASPP